MQKEALSLHPTQIEKNLSGSLYPSYGEKRP
jgi:hypothetical protein